MKKFLAAAVLGAIAVLGTMGAVHADPLVTECHSASITVNGQSVVDQAACNALPPQ